MADHLEDCATDPSHQPAIYAAFIREIVRKTKEARNPPPPTRPGSPGEMNGTIDPTLTKGYGGNQGGAGLNGMPALSGDQNHHAMGGDGGIYDPALLDDANWTGMEPPQFTFIPQGGDMM